MKYYTTLEQEKILNEIYNRNIEIKKKELKILENKTKKINKYTAYAYVHRPKIVFCVENDGSIYFDDVKPENKCLNKLMPGGKCYILDEDFKNEIENFIEKYDRYKVIFYPDGTYGPTLSYCINTVATPAILESYTGEKINIEDDNKYDIIAL